MNVLIASGKNIELFNDACKSLNQNVSISKLNIESISSFYKNNLLNEDFLQLIKNNSYIIIDGFSNVKEFFEDKGEYLFNLQKLIYYIYSINSSIDIYISFLFLEKSNYFFNKDIVFPNLNIAKRLTQDDLNKITNIDSLKKIIKNIFIINKASKIELLESKLSNKNNFELIKN